MTGYDASPQLDDDDRGHVWWRVIDELEDALAVAGMPAEDRGALAHMHQYASEWVGVEPLTIPASWKPAERTEEEEWVVRLLRRRYGREPTDAEVAERVAWHANYDIARYADNGIGKLGSIPDPAMSGLVNAGVVTIDELAKLARDEKRLRTIRGIGPKTAAAIREAIARHNQQAETRAQ